MCPGPGDARWCWFNWRGRRRGRSSNSAACAACTPQKWNATDGLCWPPCSKRWPVRVRMAWTSRATANRTRNHRCPGTLAGGAEIPRGDGKHRADHDRHHRRFAGPSSSVSHPWKKSWIFRVTRVATSAGGETLQHVLSGDLKVWIDPLRRQTALPDIWTIRSPVPEPRLVPHDDFTSALSPHIIGSRDRRHSRRKMRRSFPHAEQYRQQRESDFIRQGNHIRHDEIHDGEHGEQAERGDGKRRLRRWSTAPRTTPDPPSCRPPSLPLSFLPTEVCLTVSAGRANITVSPFSTIGRWIRSGWPPCGPAVGPDSEQGRTASAICTDLLSCARYRVPDSPAFFSGLQLALCKRLLVIIDRGERLAAFRTTAPPPGRLNRWASDKS